MASPTLYDELGGEQALRSIIDDFVDRIFADLMIGFFFRNADPARIKQMEFELAASFLGGPFTYTGKPLRSAHRSHPIMGGQFARRKRILEEVLRARHAPEHVINAWMQHTDALRPQITADGADVCND